MAWLGRLILQGQHSHSLPHCHSAPVQYSATLRPRGGQPVSRQEKIAEEGGSSEATQTCRDDVDLCPAGVE